MTASVQPFAVVYGTDQVGPEYPDKPVRYGRIVYPVDLTVVAGETKISGAFQASPHGVEGEFTVTVSGVVGIHTPKSKGVPVPRGDNDGPEGPPGWEYKDWNNISAGVRQPRRDDIKGWPETGRGNVGLAGDVNIYSLREPEGTRFHRGNQGPNQGQSGGNRRVIAQVGEQHSGESR